MSDLPGLCVTDDELSQENYITQEDVAIYLTDSGYVPGPHLTPDDILQVLAENGYVPGAHFSGAWGDLDGVPTWADVAFSGSYADLEDIPPALQQFSITEDGDLAYGDTVIINSGGEWVGSPTGLTGPQGEQGPE